MLLAALFAVPPLGAQLPADSVFHHLIGRWVLQGTIARKTMTHKVSGDSLPFLFRYTATDHFHTTFVYHRATDSWQWHMDNDSAGVRRPFARVTLTRQ